MAIPDPVATLPSLGGLPGVSGERAGAGPSVIEPMGKRVTRFTAQIGNSVSKQQLTLLKQALLEEARASFFERKFETALDGFANCIAINEHTSSNEQPLTVALYYNIGSCLHYMGELDNAKVCVDRATARPYPARFRCARVLGSLQTRLNEIDSNHLTRAGVVR